MNQPTDREVILEVLRKTDKDTPYKGIYWREALVSNLLAANFQRPGNLTREGFLEYLDKVILEGTPRGLVSFTPEYAAELAEQYFATTVLRAAQTPDSAPELHCLDCGTVIMANGYGAHHSATCEYLNYNFNTLPDSAPNAQVHTEAIRPAVLKFAHLMEWKLRLNDDRPGWKDCTKEWLLGRLKEELAELEKAHPGKLTAYEAADVANFVMMIADNEWDHDMVETMSPSAQVSSHFMSGEGPMEPLMPGPWVGDSQVSGQGRVISEELYQRLLRCSDYENVEDTVGFYQETYEQLRSSPTVPFGDNQRFELGEEVEVLMDGIWEPGYILAEGVNSHTTSDIEEVRKIGKSHE